MKPTTLYLKILALISMLLLAANTSGQETQVSFCDDTKIIDARMGSSITILKKYKDFQQATLTQTEEGYAINIVFKINGVFQFEKIKVSDSELKQLCSEIRSIPPERTMLQDDNLAQEARRRLIFMSSAFSLGYYSWAIPLAFEAEDYKAYTASYLLIGGSGFFAPLIATRDKPITNGMTAGYTMGAITGIFHGAALTLILQGDNAKYTTFLGFTSAFSITESLIGLSVAKQNDYSWGRMSAMGSGGIWGTAAATALTKVIFDSENDRFYGFSMLAGSAGGIIAANTLYKTQPTTHGDVLFINSTGILSAYWAITLTETMEIENERVAIGLTLTSASVGLAYGIYKTKGYDYSRQQGNLIGLGGFAGGLIGAGIGILAEANYKGNLWLMSLGATAGLFTTDYIVRDSRKDNNTSTSNFNFQLNPMGIVGAFNSNYLPSKTTDPRIGNTIANLRLTF